jgi:hypothetical protein
VNIIAGRAVREDGSCRVYGYVNKEVTSAAIRLDHFLSEQGAAKDQEITIVSDGAGEFEKAVERVKSIHDMFGPVPEGSASMPLWRNLRGTYWYLESVLVRAAVLNGELKMREAPEPRRFPAKRKRDDRCQLVA